MNSKLLTVAGAALIVMAMNFSAAASMSYDVAGAFPFSSDTFTGTIDINGSSVDSANITLSGAGLTGDSDLTNVAFSFETGPVWTLAVDNSDYLLSFLFTLPNTKNSDVGNIGLATLSEFFTVEVCYGKGDKDCQPETKTKDFQGSRIRHSRRRPLRLSTILTPPLRRSRSLLQGSLRWVFSVGAGSSAAA